MSLFEKYPRLKLIPCFPTFVTMTITITPLKVSFSPTGMPIQNQKPKTTENAPEPEKSTTIFVSTVENINPLLSALNQVAKGQLKVLKTMKLKSCQKLGKNITP